MPPIKYPAFTESCNRSIYGVQEQVSDILKQIIESIRQKHPKQVEENPTLGLGLMILTNFLPKTAEDFKVCADLMYAIYKKHNKVYYMTACKNCIWHATELGMSYKFSAKDDKRTVTLIISSNNKTDYTFTKVPEKGPEREYSSITDIAPFAAEFHALLKHIGYKTELTVH